MGSPAEKEEKMSQIFKQRNIKRKKSDCFEDQLLRAAILSTEEPQAQCNTDENDRHYDHPPMIVISHEKASLAKRLKYITRSLTKAILDEEEDSSFGNRCFIPLSVANSPINNTEALTLFLDSWFESSVSE